MKNQHKIGLSILLVIILAVTSSAPGLSQSEVQSWIERQLTYSSSPSYQPAIAVSGSYIHVVWYEDTTGNDEIYYLRSTDNGVTWGTKRRLARNAVDFPEPAIAVSGENIHVVWQGERKGIQQIHYKRSTNNGVSWGKTKLLTGIRRSSSVPAIAVSGANVHVVWRSYVRPNPQIFYKRSMDNGSTWSKKKQITPHTRSSYAPSIAVSGIRIHVVWLDFSFPYNVKIFYKRSINNGASWGKTKHLTNNSAPSEFPSIASSRRNIHVVWNTVGPGGDIFYKRSIDNGATWGKKKRLSNNAGYSKSSAIAVSGRMIHVVWSDNTPGNFEVYYKWSTNNGSTWRRKKLTNNAGDSHAPEIAVSGSRVHVVWSDNTPGNSEIFYKRGP